MRWRSYTPYTTSTTTSRDGDGSFQLSIPLDSINAEQRNAHLTVHAKHQRLQGKADIVQYRSTLTANVRRLLRLCSLPDSHCFVSSGDLKHRNPTVADVTRASEQRFCPSFDSTNRLGLVGTVIHCIEAKSEKLQIDLLRIPGKSWTGHDRSCHFLHASLLYHPCPNHSLICHRIQISYPHHISSPERTLRLSK